MDDICTLPHFVATHPNIASENQIRWWIYQRELNGIERFGAIVKKGRRWYINVPKLRDWILAGDEAA